MAFPERVLSITQDKLMPKVVDSILGANVFATRALNSNKEWSGEQMKWPVKVSKNATGGSFSGFDTLSTTPTDNRIRIKFDPKFYSATCSLPLDQVSVNKTDAGIIDLIAVELESTVQDAADDIGTLFYSDGTGNGGKDFLGLGAIVDDGTSVATYGEQSRSTYTTLKATVTASGGALTLAKMSTLYNACSAGSQKPSLGLTTEAVFNLYESLLQPQERIAKDVSTMKGGMTGGTGFTGLFFKGFPVLADEKCTSQALIFVNEDELDWFALPLATETPVKFRSGNIEGNDYEGVDGLGFTWSGWIKPANQKAIVGHVTLGGNLLSKNPKRHGKLTGCTSV